MSRTYRKRKGDSPSKWITHKDVVVEEWDHHSHYFRGGKRVERVWTRKLYSHVPRTGKDLKKHLALEWDSDNASYMGSPPKWFVRDFCNKPFRAKAKAEIRKMMQTAGDYDEYVFDPYKKNAKWNWW